MTNAEHDECSAIIHGASAAAAGIGGANPLPIVDAALITPIQINMIIKLGRVFGRAITEAQVKIMLNGLIMPFLGRSLAQLLTSLIPGFGNATNAATAAVLTEAIGWWAANDFDKERGKVFHVVDV